MGNTFDQLIGKSYIDTAIGEYLLARGFYEHKMRPQFSEGYDYDKLTIDNPCLERVIHDKNGKTMRIFINNIDIYYEIETSYGRFSSSGRYEARMHRDITKLSNILDEIAKRFEQ